MSRGVRERHGDDNDDEDDFEEHSESHDGESEEKKFAQERVE